MKYDVILDPGHGGSDPGASAGGLREKDIVLDIALKVEKILINKGLKVGLTRNTDVYKSISGGWNSNNRMTWANKEGAKVFVSLHCNSAENTLAQGLETFHYPGSVNGNKLATDLYNEIVKDGIYTKERKVKSANFAVLRVTNMASALIEYAFISNEKDRQLLINKKEEFAEATAKGILKYLNISEENITSTDTKLTKDNFIDIISKELVGTKTDILKSVTIAQAILESSWGQSYLSKSAKNLFGIKASSNWQGNYLEAKTKEQDKAGNELTILAKFRKYDSYKDSILDHDKFFTSTDWRTKNYKGALEAKDYIQQATALQTCGYATDTKYAVKLINLIEQHKLQRFDTELPAKNKDKEVYMNMYILGEKTKAVSVKDKQAKLWLKESKILVPIREFFETLGMNVDYKDETIYINKENK